MAERIPAPADMPDVRKMLLPSRACLLSVRDTLCPARRAGLTDAVQTARKALRKSAVDRGQAATLACVWEASACLELAANTAAPWVDPQVPAENGGWVEMTRYDPGRANRFYESSHKWDEDRYAVLSGHVFMRGSEMTMIDVLREMGLDNEDLFAAFAEAQEATAKFLRDVFAQLAQAWKQFRAYAAAFEHGLLIVPSEYGRVVDADENVIPHALLIFETRKDASTGHVGDDPLPAVEHAKYIGELACDVADHVADARSRSFDSIEIEDGKVFLKPWTNPFPFWFRRGDVSPESLAILEKDMTLSWIHVEDDNPAVPASA